MSEIINVATTAASIMTGVLVDNKKQQIMRKTDGYIEFCIYIAELANELEKDHERRFQDANKSDPGVWAYEVAEVIGAELGAYLLETGEYVGFPWRQRAAELNEAFYNC